MLTAEKKTLLIDENEPADDSLGNVLKKRREEKGYSLNQASEILKIRVCFLSAIESDNLQALPGGIYTLGFLRNYVNFLGLDPEELDKNFHFSSKKNETTSFFVKQQKNNKIKKKVKIKNLGLFLLLSFVFLGAIFFFIFFEFNTYLQTIFDNLKPYLYFFL